MTSEMGEMFNEMKVRTKEHHRKMLAQANTEGWTKHTEYHFSRMFKFPDRHVRVEWWPNSGKAKIADRMIYGHRKVNEVITRMIRKEAQG